MGYAKALSEEMHAITDFFLGASELESGRYDCIKDNALNTEEKGIQRLYDLYADAEQLLIEVLNESNREQTVASAHAELYHLYLHPPREIYNSSPYRAVFHAYMQYCLSDNKYLLDQVKQTVEKYNLQVSDKTLQEWENTSFEAWAEQHGIQE